MMPSFPVNGIGKTHREWLGGRTVPASLKFEGKLKRSRLALMNEILSLGKYDHLIPKK